MNYDCVSAVARVPLTQRRPFTYKHKQRILIHERTIFGSYFFFHCAHTSSHVTRVYVIIIRLQQRTTLKVHLPILSFVIARRLQRQTSAFAVVGLARLRDIGTGFWLPLPLSFVLQPQQQQQQ